MKLHVVYRDFEGNVHREETDPREIVDYCVDIGLPQWYDAPSVQWFTNEADATQAEKALKQ